MIGVSIINYRTGAMTIAAAQSALVALDGVADQMAGRVAIVDNASGDGSADEIAAWIEGLGDDRVSLVRSETNTGFSGGHNLGMAALEGADFFLIFNSDALVDPGFFAPMLAAADAHPRAGLFAPRLTWEDGTPQVSLFRFASPASEMIRGANSGPVTRALKHREVSLGLDPDPSQIEWASFACIFLRGDMTRAIGPMDEGYFLYFEDAEYALRAGRAGWGVIFVETARAVHFRGGSGPVKAMAKAKKRLPEYYWRSRARFMAQAHGRAGPLLANLAWGAGRALTQIRRVTGHRVSMVHEGEWRDIWTGSLDPLAERAR